jgi:hypothetical protein
MVYRDEAELGTVAVGPDGRKYRVSNEELEAAEKKAERERAKQPKAVPASGTKGKPQPEPAKPATKRRRQTTTRRKPVQKPRSITSRDKK